MRIFIIYAHADLAPVQHMSAVLRGWNHELLPSQKLLPGRDWALELREAISSADAVVYAVSPDALAAEWCQWCYREAVVAGKPVIPVLLQAETPIPEGISGFPYTNASVGVTEEVLSPLSGALGNLDAFIVSDEDIPSAPDQPGGIPAQAMGSLSISRATPPARVLLPDLRRVLPEPIEWLEIPSGPVTLKDASAQGGSKGGTFQIGRFFIARYPVTNQQYQVFIDDIKGYASTRWWDYSPEAVAWREAHPEPHLPLTDGDGAPRTYVSWYEAVAFCRWLNVRVRPLAMAIPGATPKTLPTLTLPTEQQWQRAAENDAEKMDMTGNILEWCMTAWGLDNVLLGGGLERVVRVGSQEYDTITTLSHRDLASPDEQSDRFGFRLAYVIP